MGLGLNAGWQALSKISAITAMLPCGVAAFAIFQFVDFKGRDQHCEFKRY
jgi:hypothetical protein